MRLRYRFRMQPTPVQANAIAKTFGSCRVVFNDVIALRDAALAAGRDWVSDAEVSRVTVTEAKRRPERAWLAETSAVALQQAVRDANRAYRNYFDSRTGRRKGAPVGRPRFKTRRDRRQTARFTKNARFKITADGRLRLPTLARKRPGSANRAKARSAVALLYTAVADARTEFLHRLSKRIIDENQVVVIEDLCVKGLARTRLAKSVHDAAWTRFTRMLEYKAALYGREVVKVDRLLPSTRTCSSCAVVGDHKPLHVRSWTCQHCGVLHDRDVNAAKVILAAGLAERQNACGSVEDLLTHPRERASAQRQARPPAGDWKEAGITAAAR